MITINIEHNVHMKYKEQMEQAYAKPTVSMHGDVIKAGWSFVHELKSNVPWLRCIRDIMKAERLNLVPCTPRPEDTIDFDPERDINKTLEDIREMNCILCDMDDLLCEILTLEYKHRYIQSKKNERETQTRFEDAKWELASIKSRWWYRLFTWIGVLG